MVYRGFFGQDLTEYEIDILVQSGVSDAIWEQITRNDQLRRQWQDARTPTGRLKQVFKALGMGASAAGAMYKAFTMKANIRDPGLSGKDNNIRPLVSDHPSSAKKQRTQHGALTTQFTPNPTSASRKVPTPPTIDPVRKKPITLSTDVSGNLQPAPGAHQGPSDPGPKLIKTQTVPKAVKMADVEMSGPSSDAAANQVTPVSNFQHAFEGIPRQYTTILPWWFNRTDGSVGTTAGSKYNQVFLRMNSIYDIIKSDGLTYSADPTPSVDAADGAAQEVPMWRAYWGQFWEYWTVIECRWKVTGYCTNDAANVQGCVITGYVGQQKPPIVSTGTTDLTYDEYKRWKGFDMQIFKSRGATASGLQLADKETGFSVSGVYHPGDGSHEVAEDELVQTWVRENAVPKEQNLLMIRFIRAPLSAQVAMTYHYRIELEYVVQYKDQKAIWQFPHIATTSVATSLAPSGI